MAPPSGGHTRHGGFQSQPRLDRDQQLVQGVGQLQLDGLLPLDAGVVGQEIRQEVAEGGHRDAQHKDPRAPVIGREHQEPQQCAGKRQKPGFPIMSTRSTARPRGRAASRLPRDGPLWPSSCPASAAWPTRRTRFVSAAPHRLSSPGAMADLERLRLHQHQPGCGRPRPDPTPGTRQRQHQVGDGHPHPTTAISIWSSP